MTTATELTAIISEEFTPMIADGACILFPKNSGGINLSGAKNPEALAEFIAVAVNTHIALVTALKALQASPNDPRSHRSALDALSKVESA